MKHFQTEFVIKEIGVNKAYKLTMQIIDEKTSSLDQSTYVDEKLIDKFVLLISKDQDIPEHKRRKVLDYLSLKSLLQDLDVKHQEEKVKSIKKGNLCSHLFSMIDVFQDQF